MKTEQRQAIVDFFDRDYPWWPDVYADNYPKGFFSYEMICRKEIVLQSIRPFMEGRSDLKILECGCGPGAILKELPNQDHQVIGLDINPNYLAPPAGRADRVHLTCADIENLPFANHSFDIVLAIGVLSYLSHDDRAIREMSRLLKVNGHLVLANPGFFMIGKILDPYYVLAWPYKRLRRLFRDDKRRSPERFATNRIRRYRYGQLDSLFRDCGLTKISQKATSFGPLCLWRQNVFPLHKSIHISKRFAELAEKRMGILSRFANHWVYTLEKVAENAAGAL